MTSPFLKSVAEDLYNKVGKDLSRTAIVFPNKRAGLFFNQWLSQCTDKPVWTPAYMTISELFRGLSTLQVADPIRLVCTLYTIFCQETGNEKETLDNFYFWGEMLLADFDDLDKNRVDADRMFQNLKELRQMMDDHSYLTGEQEEALRMFFHNFSIEKETELKERFLMLWNVLGNIYHRFNEVLEADGVAYEGQLYRKVVEDDTDLDSLPYDRYVFVGFNVLNQVEHRLFTLLQAKGKAMFYWDYDLHYVKHMQHEAGEFIRRNLRDFPNELTDTQLFKNLCKPKQVEYIAASTENAQARYVPQWLKKNLTEKENETAVVLCNEGLLQAVLHALPEKEVKALNITMGYPLSGTSIHSLLNLLTELYTDGYDAHSGRYIYRYVSAVLKHPYVRSLSTEAESLERQLTERNRFFPLPSELQTDEVMQLLFPSEGATTCTAMLDQLLRVINQTVTLFRGDDETPQQQSADTQLSQEALFMCYTLINRLKRLLDEGLLTVSMPIMARLLTRLLASQSIPFHGEPAIGLQVMGVLETRNLDFRNLLMLSVNEGKLPKQEGDSSFIPYNLRKAFGMTTVEHKNAVYAYYFYRLIQRAEHVTMLYNTSSEGLNRGEMSRFMLQYLVEKTPETKLERYTLQPMQNINRQATIEVQSNEEIVTRLRNRFGGGGKGILSPSALNTYLDCPLKFYLRYACYLYESDEVTTEIDPSVFGNIFHRTTEIIYKEILGKRSDGLITRAAIEDLLKDELTLRETVNRAFKEEFFLIPLDQHAEYDGLQLLNKEVITAYVKQLLRRDAEHAPFRYLAAEYAVKQAVEVIPDDGTSPFTINLGGNIDRMDEKDGTLRIVDYKTGKSIQEARNMEHLFDTTVEHRPYHVFQTFLYATLMSEQCPGKPITPALFYIQKAASADYSPVVKLNKQPVEDFTPLRSEFKPLLGKLLTEVFSPTTRFTQTTVAKHCEYCKYANICGRSQ